MKKEKMNVRMPSDEVFAASEYEIEDVGLYYGVKKRLLSPRQPAAPRIFRLMADSSLIIRGNRA